MSTLFLRSRFWCATCGVELAGPFVEWPAHCGRPARRTTVVPNANIELAVLAEDVVSALIEAAAIVCAADCTEGEHSTECQRFRATIERATGKPPL